MNVARMVVLLLGVIAGAGCYSHRSAIRMGQISSDAGASVAFPVRVTDITFSTDGTSDSDGRVRDELEKKRSNFLSECNQSLGVANGKTADCITVEMKLKPVEMDHHWLNFLLYMCTFGIIPTQIDSDISGDLVVQRTDGGVVSRIPFKSYHNGMVSCFSPFALFRNYATDTQAIREERNKTALFGRIEGRYGMFELHVETMREGVGAILAEWQKALLEDMRKTTAKQQDEVKESPVREGRKVELRQLYDAGVITEEEYRREMEKEFK